MTLWLALFVASLATWPMWLACAAAAVILAVGGWREFGPVRGPVR